MFVVLFLLAVLGANLAVSYLEPVTVWPGIQAPAGVAFVAVVLVLRDVVQRRHGIVGVMVATAGGILASIVLADPTVTLASVSAFTVSLLVDTAIFTAMFRLLKRFHLAVLISGLVSIVPDTLIFLGIADLEQFTAGQLIGKTYGTLLAWIVVYFLTRYRGEHEYDPDEMGLGWYRRAPLCPECGIRHPVGGGYV